MREIVQLWSSSKQEARYNQKDTASRIQQEGYRKQNTANRIQQASRIQHEKMWVLQTYFTDDFINCRSIDLFIYCRSIDLFIYCRSIDLFDKIKNVQTRRSLDNILTRVNRYSFCRINPEIIQYFFFLPLVGVPPSTLRFYSITQWSCSAPGSLWEVPDSNPGPLPQKWLFFPDWLHGAYSYSVKLCFREEEKIR